MITSCLFQNILIFKIIGCYKIKELKKIKKIPCEELWFSHLIAKCLGILLRWATLFIKTLIIREN